MMVTVVIVARMAEECRPESFILLLMRMSCCCISTIIIIINSIFFLHFFSTWCVNIFFPSNWCYYCYGNQQMNLDPQRISGRSSLSLLWYIYKLNKKKEWFVLRVFFVCVCRPWKKENNSTFQIIECGLYLQIEPEINKYIELYGMEATKLTIHTFWFRNIFSQIQLFFVCQFESRWIQFYAYSDLVHHYYTLYPIWIEESMIEKKKRKYIQIFFHTWRIGSFLWQITCWRRAIQTI